MKSWKLPKRDPWWARKLGLTMDWQSRPTDRTRSYHDHDRNVEVVTGYRGMRFACEVNRHEEYTTLHLAVPGLALHWRIAPGGPVPIEDLMVSWGVNTFEGDLVLDWGAKSKRIALNPFRWDGYERVRLRADGEWDATKPWTPEGKAIEWYSEGHPYLIVSEPAYCPDAMDGPRFAEVQVWKASATCHVERSIHTRRWLPFWRKVEFWVDFDLDDEVGRGKGSWKGGTVGFSERLLPGDRIADVVRRAARKGRGR